MSISKFTQQDLDLIARDYAELHEAAAERCANKEELDMVRKAFEFANNAHDGIRRRSGEPYMLHPIAVAKIVVSNIGLGYKSICAALLHDVVEDTDYTVEDLRRIFGDKIASLVDGLTKIKTVLDKEDKVQEKSIQAENFKRILLTLNDDVRVVLIKLADRLHNCRTIEFMPEYKREKILSETMFVFIPLAHRLGLYEVKSEMEDIWLRYKEPKAFNEISKSISENISDKEAEINSFIAPIESSLKAAGFQFDIKKRVKSPYSTWHKMQTKGVSFDQIYDLYAVRIIFDPLNSTESERDQCYHIFSIITGIYRYKPDRVRDWVKHPKVNGYEALHCTLMSESGVWVEVQIRTRRMDEIAEKGIAAHWSYKKDHIVENESETDKWLGKIKEILVSPDVNALELLDIIHNDLVVSEIFVFTPKGDQRSIMKGATALDFGYMIHTHIGNSAIAAKVNMKLEPLSHVLKTGDQVEIITTEAGTPKAEWLEFVRTRKARNAIQDWLKVHPVLTDEKSSTRSWSLSRLFGFSSPSQPKEEEAQSDEKKFVMADCCKPIPGDAVVGFVEDDGTITVHKKTCPNADSLASKFGNRIVIPQWKDASASSDAFLARINLKGIDRIGILNEITRYTAFVMNMNIRKFFYDTEEGIFSGYVELYVRDREDVDKLVKKLSKIEGISSVERSES